jgi:ribosomal protein L34E
MKLACKTEEELKKYMQIVRTFTDNIHMEFGLDKCADCSEVRKISSLTKFDFKREKIERGQTNRYFGTEESEGILHQQMKENLRNT